MKRLSLAALLLLPALAFSQVPAQVDCAPGTPCSSTSGPSNTGTGDPAWKAFGEINGDLSLLPPGLFGASSTGTGSNVFATSPTLITPSVTGAYVTVAPPSSGDAGAPINAAIASLSASCGSASNCGTVYLTAGNYTLNTTIVPVSGVSLIGVPSQYLGTVFLNGEGAPVGGTILVAGSATTAIAFNATNLATPSAWSSSTTYSVGQVVTFNGSYYYSLQNSNLNHQPVNTGNAFWQTWGQNALSNVRVSGIAMTGFSTVGIQIGAQNAAGCNVCEIDHIIVYNSAIAGIFKNFSGSYFHDIFSSLTSVGTWTFQQSLGATVQGMGNSFIDRIHADIVSSTNPNFITGLILGNDPAFPSGQNNFDLMRVRDVEVFSFAGRSLFSDTATFSGSTSVAMSAHCEFFPVGMPVQFTSGGSGFLGNAVTFFVLSRSASSGACNITLGNSRSGAALTAPGSGTATLAQQGMPLVDLGGLAPNFFSNSYVTGVDSEGPSFASVYLENTNGLQVDILTDTAGGLTGGVAGVAVCERAAAGGRLNMFQAGPLDFDGTSNAGTQFSGALTHGHAFPSGIYHDNTANVVGISLDAGARVGIANPDLYGNNSAFMQAAVPVAQPVNNFTGTTTINPWLGGVASVEASSASQVFTLPQLAATGTTLNATQGLPITLVNPGNQSTPQTFTVNQNATAGTGQAIIYNGVSYTTFSAPPGCVANLVAMRNAANSVSWWEVISQTGCSFGTALAISSGFGTSPALVSSLSNGLGWSLAVNVGTGGTASSGMITMPTAPHGWACSAADVTTPAGNSTQQIGSSTTTVTVTNYVRTTGVAGAWPASDIVELNCAPN